MGEFDYSTDKHFWQFHLSDGERSLAVTEDADGDGSPENAVNFQIASGFYLNHRSTSSAAPLGNTGLLKAIEDQMNNQGGLDGTYEIVEQTPPTHSYSATNELTDAGIRIKETSGNVGGYFRMKFTDANWNLDIRFLGWPSTDSPFFAESTTENGKEVLDSPFSLYGQWQVNALVLNAASDKRGRTITDRRTSSGDAEASRAQKFNEYDVRRFMYQVVPGAMVRQGRGHDEGSAKLARVGWDSSNTYSSRNIGEVHNNWATLFNKMVSPKHDDGKPRNIVVLHDETSHKLGTNNQSIEHYRMRNEGNSELADPSDFWNTQSNMGEFYELEWEGQIIENWRYRQ